MWNIYETLFVLPLGLGIIKTKKHEQEQHIDPGLSFLESASGRKGKGPTLVPLGENEV